MTVDTKADLQGSGPQARQAGSGPRWLPWLWLLIVIAMAVHQWRFWQAPALEADVFALLPQDEQAPAAQRAMKQLAEQGQRRVVVMIGAKDWTQASQAASRFEHAMQAQSKSGLRRVHEARQGDLLLDFYAPWRDALLTDAQRQSLNHASLPALSAQAIGRLHGLSMGQPTAWLTDPLGLWQGWWGERGGATAARPRDGLLWLHAPAAVPDARQDAGRDAGQDWAVLLYETEGSAFRFDGERRWEDALDRAGQAAREGAGTELTVLTAGVPLHAEASAAQGNQEMNTIGLGSLLAVIALVLVVFRALRPLTLIALSLLIGCAAGLSVTVLVFGQVHLLTLVFGASLIGVAEDFGIHYFASRLVDPQQARWPLMRHLLPGLLLALITSVLAYLVLAVVPFPGLRQMALFSAVGLLAAFATVVCWFPWLDRGRVSGSRLADTMAASLGRLPVLQGKALWLTVLVLALIGAAGLARLNVNDDLRQLQSSPPELMKAQMAVGRLLKMPSPAQFFLVRGDSEDEVLAREEALKARIAAWRKGQGKEADGIDVAAVSDWVPSRQRQLDDRQLTRKWEAAVLGDIGREMGEDLRRPEFAAEPLSLSTWLAHPASEGLRAQWLGPQEGGFASIVLIRGLTHASQAKALAPLAESMVGISWVDRADDMSRLLGRFRVVMGWLLVVGHGLVLAALLWRFGRTAWRAWLPCVLASVLCVAVLGFMGEPFQLFNLLALMLLLGIGVDYGIFLLEHAGHEQGHAWLAVVVGAISTGLSFGLLGLSGTPALRAFGLTLLIGLTLVCIMAPLMRLTAQPERSLP